MKVELLLHDETLKVLEAYVQEPSQAILLVGNAGNGKTIIARNLAAELLGVTAEKLEQYPYVKVIEPLDSKIVIEQVRGLSSFVQLAVPGSQPIARVLCIFDAESMTREAQNALLKLLEEPSPRMAIILTSSSPRKLLPTIRSRLQTLRILPPDEAKVLEHFASQGHDIESVKKALVIANGSLAKLKASLEGQDANEAILDLVKRILGAETFVRLSFVDTELKDKTKAKAFVDVLVITASASLHTSKQIGRWHKVLQSAVTAQKALAQNGNQKLVLTELMLSL